jgi:hypothetical protein
LGLGSWDVGVLGIGSIEVGVLTVEILCKDPF